jgi:hypothetical protein
MKVTGVKKLWTALILSLLAVNGRAFAVIGTIDTVPAATLLLPYFEVDITHPDGLDTLFSINNAGAGAVLAHVTIWTDQSIPAMNFDVYLTGYDVQTLSLRDILVNGNLPATAPRGQDPLDRISPRGPFSQDVDLASCSGLLPYQNLHVSTEMRAHVQAWLQGRRSPLTDNCAGSRQLDEGILRGYVTIDTVSACNLFFPSSWAEYGPLVTHQNVLWGDVFYVNPAERFAHGETLVHIEACPTCFTQGDHTFYGRYNGASGADAREALPTTMAARFVNGGAFSGGTSFLIWRETDSWAGAYPCSWHGPLSWYPLRLTEVEVFDEEEQTVTPETCPSAPTCEQPIEIANAAQRAKVVTDFLVPFDSGWVYLNLQHGDLYGDPYAQMWAIATMDTNGRFSVGFDAIQMDNANAPIKHNLPRQ